MNKKKSNTELADMVTLSVGDTIFSKEISNRTYKKGHGPEIVMGSGVLIEILIEQEVESKTFIRLKYSLCFKSDKNKYNNCASTTLYKDFHWIFFEINTNDRCVDKFLPTDYEHFLYTTLFSGVHHYKKIDFENGDLDKTLYFKSQRMVLIEKDFMSQYDDKEYF